MDSSMAIPLCGRDRRFCSGDLRCRDLVYLSRWRRERRCDVRSSPRYFLTSTIRNRNACIATGVTTAFHARAPPRSDSADQSDDAETSSRSNAKAANGDSYKAGTRRIRTAVARTFDLELEAQYSARHDQGCRANG